MSRRQCYGLLLAAAFALLLSAWVTSTHPWDAPDEQAHYLRALTLTQGHLLGRPAPQTVPSGDSGAAARARWINHDMRGIVVSPAQTPPGIPCVTGYPIVGGSGCLEATWTGDYYPLAYVLPAAAIGFSSSADSGLWLARAASALVCLALLWLAIALTLDGAGWAVLGLLVAVTPAVFYVSSILNPSGLEVAAALAVIAGLSRLRRDPLGAPLWVWIGVAVSGATLVLTWQMGPAFLAVDVLAFAALAGRQTCRLLVKNRTRRVIGIGVTIAAALGAFLLYGTYAGVLHSQIRISPIRVGLQSGWAELSPTLKSAVGTFGEFDVWLPRPIYVAWWLLVVALVAFALWVGNPRERIVTLAVLVLSIAFPVVFYAWSYRLSGFGMQGRYVLPLLVLVPMVAGDIVEHHDGGPLPARWIVGGGAAIIAVMQLLAWRVNARTFAGVIQVPAYLEHGRWAPPLGWAPWIAAAICGTCALISAALLWAADRNDVVERRRHAG